MIISNNCDHGHNMYDHDCDVSWNQNTFVLSIANQPMKYSVVITFTRYPGVDFN